MNDINMLKDITVNSLYFGLVLTIAVYMMASAVKKKIKIAVFNPLLISVLVIIAILLLFNIDYGSYKKGGDYINYFLTPVTVCLGLPLYRQLKLLKKYFPAVIISISAGVITNAVLIFIACKIFSISHIHYVSLLPKSITTAIAIGVSEEAGGISSLTVLAILITGITGNVFGESILNLVKVKNPISRGLALGTSAHAIGTSKALELGEVEGAMSSLSIAIAGLLTVALVPVISGLI